MTHILLAVHSFRKFGHITHVVRAKEKEIVNKQAIDYKISMLSISLYIQKHQMTYLHENDCDERNELHYV